MRKILLGTTAVIGAALIAPVAMAQTAAPVEAPRALASRSAGLTVRLGGYFDFRGGMVNDDADRNAVTSAITGRNYGRQRTDFQSDMELNVFVDGKAANGLRYGLVMEFQIDNVGAGAGTALDTDEVYGYVSHPVWGTLRFGDEDSAGNLLQVRTPLVRGSDTDNYWDEFTFRRGADGSTSFFTALNDGNDSTKIIYLSPQFFGFDFGVSYSPNRNEGERFSVSRGALTPGINIDDVAAQRDRTGLRNEISAGIRYRGTFGGVGIAASLVGMQADGPARYTGANEESRVNAYSGGLQLSAYGFRVGGEYTWGDYDGVSVGGSPLTRGRDQSTQWVVGATYSIPGTALQLGGFYGEAEQDNGGSFEDRKQTLYSAGVNYALAPGMTLYASYSHLRDRNEIAGGAYVDNNQAAPGVQRTRNLEVYMIGTRIAF